MSGRISLLLAVAACYSPPEPDCGFICGPGGACPTDYTCASDNRCHRNGTPPTLQCGGGAISFDVQMATAISPTSFAVVFSAPPDPTSATTLANYSVANLTLTGTPMLTGSTVLIETMPQAKTSYTVMVGSVTRASDGQTLGTTTATFAGIPPFDVMSAQSVTSHSISVTFDAAPDPTLATDVTHYSVPTLLLSGTPMLTGSTVTIQTSAQMATTYTVTVTGVKRASDELALATDSAMFTGRAPFDVTGAAPTNMTTLTVTYDAPPDMTTATTLGNYTVSGLTLSAPMLTNSTVTFTTTAQCAATYMVTVGSVVRASDMEPLTTTMATSTSPNHCIDSVHDCDETDTDCGGPTCNKCASGKMCMQGTDCLSGTCNGTTCM